LTVAADNRLQYSALAGTRPLKSRARRGSSGAIVIFLDGRRGAERVGIRRLGQPPDRADPTPASSVGSVEAKPLADSAIGGDVWHRPAPPSAPSRGAVFDPSERPRRRIRRWMWNGVAFLVVATAGGVTAPVAVAQIASVTVSARVVAPDDPVVHSSLRPAEPRSKRVARGPVPADAAPLTIRPVPGRPAVIRTRLRSEPRTGMSGAGPVLEVILDYVGN
jgi:hypothetical protein